MCVCVSYVYTKTNCRWIFIVFNIIIQIILKKKKWPPDKQNTNENVIYLRQSSFYIIFFLSLVFSEFIAECSHAFHTNSRVDRWCAISVISRVRFLFQRVITAIVVPIVVVGRRTSFRAIMRVVRPSLKQKFKKKKKTL